MFHMKHHIGSNILKSVFIIYIFNDCMIYLDILVNNTKKAKCYIFLYSEIEDKYL